MSSDVSVLCLYEQIFTILPKSQARIARHGEPLSSRGGLTPAMRIVGCEPAHLPSLMNVNGASRGHFTRHGGLGPAVPAFLRLQLTQGINIYNYSSLCLSTTKVCSKAWMAGPSPAMTSRGPITTPPAYCGAPRPNPSAPAPPLQPLPPNRCEAVRSSAMRPLINRRASAPIMPGIFLSP
jgi:hypothetical protein